MTTDDTDDVLAALLLSPTAAVCEAEQLAAALSATGLTWHDPDTDPDD